MSYEYTQEVEKWEGDGHSHSYFTFKELEALAPKFKNLDWYKVMKLLARKYGDENVRLCFFFDN